MDTAVFTDPTELARPKLLVVDDDETLSNALQYNLRREGYAVLTAENGPEALRIAFTERPDLIILDIMLPGMNGFDVCRAIRAQMSVPILMLSAREAEIDKVLALELGADDYISKPFGLAELLARVRAQLRRADLSRSGHPLDIEAERMPAPLPGDAASGLAPRQILVSESLSIDLEARTVVVSGHTVKMKPKEFELLAFLAGHPAKVFSREALLEAVWGYRYVGGTRTADVHIRWLREKIEQDPAEPQFIQTVHRAGYKFGRPVTLRTLD